MYVKVCEELRKPGMHLCMVSWCYSSWFHTVPYIIQPNFQFRCSLDDAWVAISRLKSWSVWGLSFGCHWGGSSQWQWGQKKFILFPLKWLHDSFTLPRFCPLIPIDFWIFPLNRFPCLPLQDPQHASSVATWLTSKHNILIHLNNGFRKGMVLNW